MADARVSRPGPPGPQGEAGLPGSDADATAAVEAHRADTTAVHGIADTAGLLAELADARARLVSVESSRSGFDIARLDVVGHSHAAEGGASAQDYAASYKLATHLGVKNVRNVAIGGAKAATDAISPGGYYTVLQEFDRSGSLSAPYLAKSQVALVNYGLGDIPQWGPAGLGPFDDAIRTIIRRLRAAAVFERTHASIAYGGIWADVVGAGGIASGAGYKTTTDNAATISVAVPADFPGGDVALGFISMANGDGADWRIAVDGGAAVALDTRNRGAFNHGSTRAATGQALAVTHEIKGLSAGAHTIAVTINARTGTAAFNFWSIRAEEPPLIAVVEQLRPYAISSTFFDGFPYNAAAGFTQADITNVLNPRLQAIAAEFDADVFYLPINDVIGAQQKNTHSDNVHLNNRGHGLVAERYIRQITDRPVKLRQLAMAQIAMRRTPKLIGKLNQAPPFQNGWQSIYHPLKVFKDPSSGLVTIQGNVQQAVAAANAANLVVFALAPGFRPLNGFLDFQISKVVGGVFSEAFLRIDTNGNVYVVSGGTNGSGGTTWNSLSASFVAEA